VPLRDIVLTATIAGLLPFILFRPELGVLTWTWLSLMNPHRLTWDFAYRLPFAMVVGAATLASLLISKEPKRMPITPTTVVLILFILWMSLTTLFAMEPVAAWPEWKRMIKVQLMVFVTMMVMQSRERLHWLVWVIVLSLGFYGFKGGIFTVRTGGQSMVLGPDGSFIDMNTTTGLALVMTLPLMRYLQLNTENKWVRRGLVVLMLTTAIAILGTQSRGALLAAIAMGGFLWLKSRYKMVTTIVMIVAIPVMLSMMPQTWWDRMATIQNYEQDGSALGRINAWHFAYNIAKERPIHGGGYNVFTPELFQRYAPDPLNFHDAHSIYFEVLGEHGFVGLTLFLILMWLAWRTGSWIIKQAKTRKDVTWARDLASMTQVSIVGYAVGGAFLGLAYFDFYYNLISLLVLAQVIVKKQLEQNTETVNTPVALPSASARGEKRRFGNVEV
jgi:probable O-glycosylation ligase (exosortase A-associated)